MTACYNLDLASTRSNEMSFVALRLIVTAPVAKASRISLRKDKCIVVEFSSGSLLVEVTDLITVLESLCFDDDHYCDKDCETQEGLRNVNDCHCLSYGLQSVISMPLYGKSTHT